MIGPMIDGRKRVAESGDAPRPASLWRAAVLLALSGLAVAGLVNL